MRLELPARSRSDKMMAGPGSQTDSSSPDTGIRAALVGGLLFPWAMDGEENVCIASICLPRAWVQFALVGSDHVGPNVTL